MTETTKTIGEWSDSTFGASTTNLRKAIRVNTEMAELLTLLILNDNNPHAIEESADICIVLHSLVHNMGGDLDAAIQGKMAINRIRKWKLDGSGCGQHE